MPCPQEGGKVTFLMLNQLPLFPCPMQSSHYILYTYIPVLDVPYCSPKQGECAPASVPSSLPCLSSHPPTTTSSTLKAKETLLGVGTGAVETTYENTMASIRRSLIQEALFQLSFLHLTSMRTILRQKEVHINIYLRENQ